MSMKEREISTLAEQTLRATMAATIAAGIVSYNGLGTISNTRSEPIASTALAITDEILKQINQSHE